jgi:uncharacterized protein
VTVRHTRMNETNTISRRQAFKLFGAAILATNSGYYGCAAHKRRILLFTKSSGFEHDVVKKTDQGPSLCETTLTNLGRIHGFETVATKDGRVFDSDLAQFDAFFFFTTGNLTEVGADKTPPMSARGKEATCCGSHGQLMTARIYGCANPRPAHGYRYRSVHRSRPHSM